MSWLYNYELRDAVIIISAGSKCFLREPSCRYFLQSRRVIPNGKSENEILI